MRDSCSDLWNGFVVSFLWVSGVFPCLFVFFLFPWTCFIIFFELIFLSYDAASAVDTGFLCVCCCSESSVLDFNILFSNLAFESHDDCMHAFIYAPLFVRKSVFILV